MGSEVCDLIEAEQYDRLVDDSEDRVAECQRQPDRRRWPQYQVRRHRQTDDGEPSPEGRHKEGRLDRMRQSIHSQRMPVNAEPRRPTNSAEIEGGGML